MTVNSRSEGEKQSELTHAALDVLADEYACRILVALERGPKPATDLMAECDASGPTVYRRLDRLEELGFVSARQEKRAGHQPRKRYRLTLQKVAFEIDESGVACRAETDPIGP